MSFIPTPGRQDIEYWTRNATATLAPPLNGTAIVRTLTPEDPTFPGEMRRAFEFLRAHGDGRYTSDSLMGILSLADTDWERGDRPAAFLLVAEVPYSFDEETEVKVGGTLGMLVQMNNGSNRALCAVAEPYRRNKVASALLGLHANMLGQASFWVAANNRPAQHFLLSQGLQVVQMNRRGALRYTSPHLEDGEEEA